MNSFIKLFKPEEEEAKRYCDDLVAIFNIYNNYDKRGQDKTIDNLNVYIPGLKQKVSIYSNLLVEKSVKNNIDLNDFLKNVLPIDIKIYVGQLVSSRSNELKNMCLAYKNKNKVGGKRGKNIKKY